MTKHFFVFLSFFVSLSSAMDGSMKDYQCFRPGECMNSYHVDGVHANDAMDCLRQCRAKESCSWFTFHPDNNFCEMFSGCNYLDAISCPECSSGQRECYDNPPVCMVSGQCHGNTMSEEKITSVDACLELCKTNQPCTWFTYFPSSSACVLFYNCDFVDTSCETCISGEERCESETPEVEPEWHMIIGGGAGDIRKSVEMFNWKTLAQCRMPDLNVYVQGHVGGVLEGRPLFCVQAASAECFAYNKVTHHWDQVNKMISSTSFAGSVNVPNQGWLVYGGNNNLGTTQLLAGVNQQWMSGPPIFNGQVDNDGVCAVQINDTMTVYLGGRVNFHAITTYDWNLGTYSSRFPELQRPRKYSGCAMATLPNGQRVVAIAGGVTYKDGQGMEFWNPDDGSVTVVVDQLPTEIGSLTPLQDSRLLSINGGTELLLYGGRVSADIDAIWKYTVADNSWKQIGRMTYPRQELVVLPVPDITC